MTAKTSENAPKLALIGAGHAHLAAIPVIRRHFPTLPIVLVSDNPVSLYSGAVPGYVAGLLPERAMAIPLKPLADKWNLDLVIARAVRIDAAAKRIVPADGRAVAYGLASLDLGGAPNLAALPGAAENAISVRPLGEFIRRWDEVMDRARQAPPRHVSIIGGGLGGIEIAFAVKARLARHGTAVTLVTGTDFAPGLQKAAKCRVESSLAQHGIQLCPRVARACPPGGPLIEGAGALPADLTLVATGIAAPELPRASALPMDADGFIVTGPTLQVAGDADLFAAGDCATLVGADGAPLGLPKAGVQAVRQGPWLAGNLIRRIEGRPLQPFPARRAALALVGTGDGSAIAIRPGLPVLEGRAMWWWKRWLDGGWVQSLNQ